MTIRSTYIMVFAMVASLVFASCSDPEQQANQETTAWDMASQILQRVTPPSFPEFIVNVGDRGAVAGDGQDDLLAFRAAITEVSAAGGGRVVVSAGDYLLAGPIHLLSNVNLHLESDAYVRFSQDPQDYLPVVKTRWEGAELMNYSPLIYAYEQENIAITGEGTFDGQADEAHWWPWKSRKDFPVEEFPGGPMTSSRDLLIKMNREQVPVEERIFGEGHTLRPNFVQPYLCKNVWIEGVTFRNSPMWIMHPVECENVLIEGVSVISHGPNSDGCDPESCKDVVIRDCYFDTGDDCIALKSGRNQDGRRIARPIEQVVVTGCEMKDGHGGIVIGSEVSGGARYIFGENCLMDSPNLDRAVRVKTNRSRGGVIEHLYFRNLKVGTVRESVVKVNMQYTLDDSISLFMPEIHDVVVENVQSSSSKYGVQLIGYDQDNPVRGVTVRNCDFDGVESGNLIEYANEIVFDSLLINGALSTVP